MNLNFESIRGRTKLAVSCVDSSLVLAELEDNLLAAIPKMPERNLLKTIDFQEKLNSHYCFEHRKHDNRWSKAPNVIFSLHY